MSHGQQTHHDMSSNTLFGFWIYLMTDVVMFATFFATYAVLQNNTFGGPTAKELFDVPLALGQTLVLLFSSFCCGVAMTFAPKQQVRKMAVWFGLTFVLGALFLTMQMHECRRLFEMGQTWQNNAFLSSYFSLVGIHGLHIVAGLLLLIVFWIQFLRWGFTEKILTRLTCLKMYWHFLYLIWIFTFAIVYLIGVR